MLTLLWQAHDGKPEVSLSHCVTTAQQRQLFNITQAQSLTHLANTLTHTSDVLAASATVSNI